jgi:hypothetical protein
MGCKGEKMGFKSLRKALKNAGQKESGEDYLERVQRRKKKAQKLMKEKKGK